MWHPVFAAAELAEGEATRRVVAGRALALVHRAGVFHALDDRCPHDAGPLGEGTLEDGALACPWHGWRFELATGRCLQNETLRQECFATRVRAGVLEVELP